MHCPFCTAIDTKVVDSRMSPEGDKIRRRRHCPDCGERFTTYEVAELAMPMVVKQDNRREAFSESKLRAGMHHALEKRPVGSDQVDVAVGGIISQLRASGDREINSRKLGELVMNALRELDQVAYVRFASVYLSFEDVQAFRDLAERLQTESSVSEES